MLRFYDVLVKTEGEFCLLINLTKGKFQKFSKIENVQRPTLNPIDEGLAFRKYVNEFGWGGVSELAQKLSKSNQQFLQNPISFQICFLIS